MGSFTYIISLNRIYITNKTNWVHVVYILACTLYFHSDRLRNQLSNCLGQNLVLLACDKTIHPKIMDIICVCAEI